jgi:hypothetical protein
MHCPFDGGGDVLDILVHQKVQLSDVVNDILVSSDLSKIISILQPDKISEVLDPIEKLRRILAC